MGAYYSQAVTKALDERAIINSFSSRIGQLPSSKTIFAMLEGCRIESGTLPVSGSGPLYSIGDSPKLDDLNNYHCHFHGGAYRTSTLLTSLPGYFSNRPIVTLLRDLGPDANISDLQSRIAGFSFRFLSRTLPEVWRDLDRLTPKITQHTPEEFGEIYRAIKEMMTRNSMKLSLYEGGEFSKKILGEIELPEIDLNAVKMESERASKIWRERVEPKTLNLMKAMIDLGYSYQDFYI